MRAVATTICIALLVLASGCYPVKVETDYAPTTDFSARKTYAWRSDPYLDTGDPRFDNPQMEEQVRRVVETVLASKGFEKANAGEPGFVIEFVAGVGSGSNTVTRNSRTDGNLRDWWRSGSHTVAYEEGMLVLAMTDPTTGEVLWLAAASGVLKKQADAVERRERLGKVLRKMLNDFPPKP